MTVRQFTRYPEYKSSGVEWLGEMPAHWQLTKMWDATEAISGGTPAKETLRYWDGNIPWVSPKDMKRRFIDSSEDTVSAAAVSETRLKLIPPPAVLMVVRGMILAHSFPVGITKVPVTINQDIKALRLRDDIHPEFFGYWLEGVSRDLLATTVDEAAHGTKAIRMDRWRITPIEIPPDDEQRAIAAFLDRETARIDALLAKNESLIELLVEKRSAVVTQAVTSGLDPHASMKDAGVPWLGEIPAGWRILRLKFLLRRIEQGWSPLAEQREAGEEEWAVLKAGCVNAGRFDEREHKALPSDITPPLELEIREGDVLLSRANTRELLGSVAVVGKVRPKLLLCDKLYRLAVASEEIESRYIAPLLAATSARHQLEIEAVGASTSMQNITQNTIRQLIVPIPQRVEQVRLLDFIENETAKIDTLLSRIRDAIQSLTELRTALISAAVTGKIDVREETA